MVFFLITYICHKLFSVCCYDCFFYANLVAICHSVAFHRGFHCLTSTRLGVSSIQRVLNVPISCRSDLVS